MGLFHSRVTAEDSWNTQRSQTREFEVGNVEACVEHFMPPTFPIIPVITPNTLKLCTESWNEIIREYEQVNELNISTKISGMTLFYTEFYDLLDRLDPAGTFDAVLSLHCGGQNKIAAKGAILIRIVKFALNLDFSNPKQVDYQLFMLGKAHGQKTIRPWMYSVFIQCFLNTIGNRLGSKATSEVMGAWVNLFAYILRKMLPPAIEGKIVETEFNAVITQDVLNDDVTNQKDMRKKFEKASKSRSTTASRTTVDLLKFESLTRVPSFATPPLSRVSSSATAPLP